jgi:hypothetical protein
MFMSMSSERPAKNSLRKKADTQPPTLQISKVGRALLPVMSRTKQPFVCRLQTPRSVRSAEHQLNGEKASKSTGKSARPTMFLCNYKVNMSPHQIFRLSRTLPIIFNVPQGPNLSAVIFL